MTCRNGHRPPPSVDEGPIRAAAGGAFLLFDFRLPSGNRFLQGKDGCLWIQVANAVARVRAIRDLDDEARTAIEPGKESSDFIFDFGMLSPLENARINVPLNLRLKKILRRNQTQPDVTIVPDSCLSVRAP
jgi:hypothetical protein